MFRVLKFILLISTSAFLLTGCLAPLEEKAAEGVKAARIAFYENAKDRTEEIDGVKLYKPAGFKVNENSDAQNIIFTRNDETFVLFVNPNEKSDSQLFYDLLLAERENEIIANETFTDNGVFGFAAVMKSGEEEVELIASVGGSKMTTIAKEKRIKEELTRMMEVVRSVEKDSVVTQR